MGRGLGWMRLNRIINIGYIGFGNLNLLLLRGWAGLTSLGARLRHINIFTSAEIRLVLEWIKRKSYRIVPYRRQGRWEPRLFETRRLILCRFYIGLSLLLDICRLKLFINISLAKALLLPWYEVVEVIDVLVEVLVELVTVLVVDLVTG